MIQLSTPLAENAVRDLKVGDEVTITGTLFTGRDAVHKYLHEGASFLPRSFCGRHYLSLRPVIIKDEQGQWKCTRRVRHLHREEPYQWQIIRISACADYWQRRDG